MNTTFTRYWPWFFFAAAFESLFAILWLILIPSEGGLSMARFALMAILFLFFAFGIYLGFRARNNSTQFDGFVRPILIFYSTLLALTSSLLLFFLRYLNPEKLLPYYDRLSPLLWYFLVVGIQAAIFFLLIKNGLHPDEISKRKPVYRYALVAICILFAVFIFIVITKIGITPDTGYWGEPGVAILGWHTVLSILIGLFVLLYGLRISKFDSSRAANIFIPIAIYLIASALWLSVPVSVLENSFYSPITPPANMPFPYSDAGFYDYLAQSLLIGTSYLGGIPPRPLYVVFLAVLHFFFGQNYPAIIAAQTLVLALFPVALYFLGKKLHSPAAGVVVALFAIFRELVGLWISSNTRVANSKIFTTDFPTALGIAILCLVVIWWLERRDLRPTLIAGGAFGLLLLFRTQSLFTLPAIFILVWFAYQRKTKEWILAGMVFVFAIATTHFFNTEIGGLLALPLIKSFDGLLAPVNLYWVGWDGSLEWYNFLLVLFYLVIIAVGFGAAWRRAAWIGLVPLAFNLGYALANGISRFSSWRYNLPVDWVIYFYFAIC